MHNSKRSHGFAIWLSAVALAGCGGGTSLEAPSASLAIGDCSADGNIFSIPGNTAQMNYVDYATDGITVVRSPQINYQVSSGGNFRGESGLTTLTSNQTDNSGIRTTRQSYSKIVGEELLQYGFETSTNISMMPTGGRTYYTPPLGLPTHPALNTLYSRNYASTTVYNGLSPTQHSAETVLVAYLGVEQVTALAGSFAGCKIKTQSTSNGESTVIFKWIVANGRLKGHLLKTEDATGKKTMEAKDLLVNNI